MAARNRKGLSENTRARIQTSMIVNRLEKHIVSKPEFDKETNTWINKDLMTQSQVTAALGLIKKTLPDLSSVESKQEITHRHVNELTDAELYSIAATGSTRDTESASGKSKLN